MENMPPVLTVIGVKKPDLLPKTVQLAALSHSMVSSPWLTTKGAQTRLPRLLSQTLSFPILVN